MNEQQYRSDAELTRLMDIYKIHVQELNNISTQRMVVNRFYQLLLTGIALAFFTFLQLGTKFLPEAFPIDLKESVVIMRFLGGALAWVWGVSMNSILKLSARKHEVLKELEAELDFPFFTRELDFLSEWDQKKNYGDIYHIEFQVPLCICALLAGGFFIQFQISHWMHYVYMFFSAFFVVNLIFLSFRSLTKKQNTSDEPT